MKPRSCVTLTPGSISRANLLDFGTPVELDLHGAHPQPLRRRNPDGDLVSRTRPLLAGQLDNPPRLDLEILAVNQHIVEHGRRADRLVALADRDYRDPGEQNSQDLTHDTSRFDGRPTFDQPHAATPPTSAYQTRDDGAKKSLRPPGTSPDGRGKIGRGRRSVLPERTLRDWANIPVGRCRVSTLKPLF